MNRDEYVQKLKAQLDEWNAEVKTWEAKARSAEAEVKAGYERQLDAFRRQRDQSLEHLRKVQAASGEAWTDMMRGADDAWAKMREAFTKARSHFEQK
jgi:lipid II:glycine glycyltransferase (peptidoglycan interpeptide bridge formation enzyme)